MMTVTVDTSVITKWFTKTDETHWDAAITIREFIVSRKIKLIVPTIIILELINVLKFSKQFTSEETVISVNSFIQLCDRIVEIPDTDLIINCMYKDNLASYDAVFITLAESENIPLITADYKHHRKSISKQIIWLSEWEEKTNR